jgi:hypothetical protein
LCLPRIPGNREDIVYILTSGWRRMHNGELHNLYGSPIIIKVIKSRRMGLVGHAWER